MLADFFAPLQLGGQTLAKQMGRVPMMPNLADEHGVVLPRVVICYRQHVSTALVI